MVLTYASDVAVKANGLPNVMEQVAASLQVSSGLTSALHLPTIRADVSSSGLRCSAKYPSLALTQILCQLPGSS
ncbi:MAG: hypothetical protein WCL39_04365 [Armatimonadota bacterium]